MGRRRTRKVVKRVVRTLPNIFVCPKCGGKSVKVAIDKEARSGKVQCGHCKLEDTIEHIRRIDEAVDVYSQWLDAYYGA